MHISLRSTKTGGKLGTDIESKAYLDHVFKYGAKSAEAQIIFESRSSSFGRLVEVSENAFLQRSKREKHTKQPQRQTSSRKLHYCGSNSIKSETISGSESSRNQNNAKDKEAVRSSSQRIAEHKKDNLPVERYSTLKRTKGVPRSLCSNMAKSSSSILLSKHSTIKENLQQNKNKSQKQVGRKGSSRSLLKSRYESMPSLLDGSMESRQAMISGRRHKPQSLSRGGKGKSQLSEDKRDAPRSLTITGQGNSRMLVKSKKENSLTSLRPKQESARSSPNSTWKSFKESSYCSQKSSYELGDQHGSQFAHSHFTPLRQSRRSKCQVLKLRRLLEAHERVTVAESLQNKHLLSHVMRPIDGGDVKQGNDSKRSMPRTVDESCFMDGALDDLMRRSKNSSTHSRGSEHSRRPTLSGVTARSIESASICKIEHIEDSAFPVTIRSLRSLDVDDKSTFLLEPNSRARSA